jgi:opacity protein-like surface antigen/outer membrane protease
MKRFLFGSAALLVPISASGADLPVKAAAAPPWNWAGLYVGAQVGGVSGTTDFSDPFGAPIFGDKVRSPGFFGGGQIGYNWQAPNSPWVFGLEADVSGLDSDETNTCFGVSADALNTTCRVRPEAAGTFTGRVGYAAGPAGHTLLYAKGGAAWAFDRIDLATNDDNSGRDGLPPIAFATTSKIFWGWTAGAGVEQALSSAWSLKFEYDYLGLGGNVANLGNLIVTPAKVVTGGTAPSSSGFTQNIQEFKLGVIYHWGANPWSSWNESPVRVSTFPVKVAAPQIAWLPGWNVELGGRYFGSWGQFHTDTGQFVAGGAAFPSNISRLTYDGIQTNSGEFFGRIDTPWNVFVKGFVGGGTSKSGQMTDEDFGIFKFGGMYSNTLSNLGTGSISYGVIDGGYDFLHGPGYKVGAFAGYFSFHQFMAALGCQSIAATQCAGVAAVPASTLLITEADSWKALRVGASGEAMMTDRIKLSADIAYLPVIVVDAVDEHIYNKQLFPAKANAGGGVQLEAIASYYLTPQFSIGVGGRYWAIWSENGSNNNPARTPTNWNGAAEQAGGFVQAAYKFW